MNRLFFLTLSAFGILTIQIPAAAEIKRKESFEILYRKGPSLEVGEIFNPTLVADFNRDGKIDSEDYVLSQKATRPSVLILANVDDDDSDGKVDHLDRLINGPADLNDLTEVLIENPRDLKHLQLKISGDIQNFQFFNGSNQQFLEIDNDAINLAGINSLRIEAKDFARKPHGASIMMELLENGNSRGHVKARVAPWIMMANSNPTSTVYIASGHRNYHNQSMIENLRAILSAKQVELFVHRPWGQQGANGSGQFHEMWVQDGMEIGYTKIPGSDLMHVVLKGLRRTEKLAPKLMGPNFGIIEVGMPRNLTGGDSWADWMGNLEVSAPVSGFPLGRIYYGINRNTGIGLHPEVIEFLEAQEIQSPFSINTSWLTIKHVDEIFNFIRGASGNLKMILASPREAAKILKNSSHNNQYNRNIQSEIDRSRAVIQRELGLQDSDIIDVPVFYLNGHNIWSSPVNSIYINGTVIFGDTFIPGIIKSSIVSKMNAIGLHSAFVDDNRYQRNFGNVHCATNTKKIPLNPNWWMQVIF